jgi:exosortase N
MIAALPIPFSARRLLLPLAGLALLACCIYVFNGYLKPLSLSFVLGLAALPFTFSRAAAPGGGKTFAIVGFCFLVLTMIIPVKTLLFLGLGALLFATATNFGYQCRLLTVIVWCLLSPMFAYLANAFSFPVRLQLASWCGSILHLLAVPVSIQGNVIEDGHGRFSIDPGCMGLNMLVASLLLGAMLLGYFEMRLQKRISTVRMLGFFAMLAILNVVSNLVRILLLVWFVWLPGTIMHELAGLVCLALYVGLPSYFCARWMVRRSQPTVTAWQGKRLHPYLLPALFSLFGLLSIRVVQADTALHLDHVHELALGTYRASEVQPGVVKLQDASHLVYIKFIRGFYDMDHNPTICWEGSGYTFTEVGESTVSGFRIYTAVLAHGRERLYTAWWYSNGKAHTCRQWEWRRRALYGEGPFAVVNVTAPSPEERRREVERVLKKGIIQPVFNLAGAY